MNKLSKDITDINDNTNNRRFNERRMGMAHLHISKYKYSFT